MTIFKTFQRIAAAFVPLLAVFAFSTSSAFAQGGGEPWWHLAFESQPSYVQPGHAADEVQRLTVAESTASGSFVVRDEGVGARFRGGGGEVAELQAGETPAEVQATLEGNGRGGEPLYGAGNLEVTSPCTGTSTPACPETYNRYEVYEIKFVGQWADEYVSPLQVEPLALQEHVKVTQTIKGRPDGTLLVDAVNLGDADTVGPITLADKLPKGLVAVGVEAAADEATYLFGKKAAPVECKLETVSCTFTGSLPAEFADEFSEGYPTSVLPYNRIVMRIAVKTNGATLGQSESDEASVTGGGAPSVTAKTPVAVSDEPVPFAISTYEQRPEEAGGGVGTQAGLHPFQYTTTSTFTDNLEGPLESKPTGLAKDLHFKLPPGVVGNPIPFAECSDADFASERCPQDTVIGVAMGRVQLLFEKKLLAIQFHEPLFNLEPAFGEPARFGFIVNEASVGPRVPVQLKTAVRTGGDYGVTVNVSNISEIAEFFSSEVTFWGVPGDERHNFSRGRECLRSAYDVAAGESGRSEPCTNVAAPKSPPPFMTLPTSCTGPLHTTLEADSWLEPSVLTSTLNTAPMPALDGCDRLPFGPEIKVAPDAQQASKPTGLTVDVHVPQEGQLNPQGLAQSNVKNIVVRLPDGVAINPSGGDGLSACSEAQIGFEGSKELQPEFEPGVSTLTFSPKLPGSYGSSEALDPGVNFCPDSSKIGEATIRTPLLPEPLKGFVYLAAQEANPFGSVVGMYLVAEDPVAGVLVKLAGKVQLCQNAGETIAGMTCQGLGQIITTFENNPQLPFEDAELHFFGGERAPLAGPAHCGKYTTQASYAPWSGSEAVNASSSFEVTSGPVTLAHPGGTPCPGASLPFEPTSTGGATNVNAGAFSPLTTTFSREPGEQSLQSAEVTLPEGLSGLLSSVELCREPQASQGTCGPNSQIGETTVSVGVGGDPYTVKGGKVFITGPYNGSRECTVGEAGCAPFGLSVANPAKAGPYDLANTKSNHPVCDCILVRGKIEINPETTVLRITSNPPGTPGSIPTSIEGIPLQIQHVNIITTRSAFQFNPTNCDKTEFAATLHSAEGGVDQLKIPFQVTNCAALKFEPKFSVSTSGKTSKANGASLTARVVYPKVPQGTDADIARVKVELPKVLPSRLTTLQKACTQQQFKANPAGCPPASLIGTAVVHTQLLPVPLEGPVYFVSNGGEAFPNLIMVLQGYGITIDLVGDTFISKSGITSTTFKTVPDQPFENFELSLHNGPYSALAANGNLCAETKTITRTKKETRKIKGKTKKVTVKVKSTEAESLVMPTEFIGQNGAQIKQNTHISVSGCPPSKTAAQLRAAKLAAALKACHKKKGSKRSSCEKAARKSFGTKHKASKKK